MGITEKRFIDNMPTIRWVKNFIESRSELSERLTENIKRARAGVNREAINEYFDNLERSLVGVNPEFILNYDETCFIDDIGKTKIITRRGCKHPERIIDTSKTSISVMFSCTASGCLLPPYVCYKSEHLHDSWKRGVPRGCRYNRTRSGWFDSMVFEDWFKNIILPYFKSIDTSEGAVRVPKVIIGDNLASHVNPNVINLCKENNIRFLLLPTFVSPWMFVFSAQLKEHGEKSYKNGKKHIVEICVKIAFLHY